MAKTYGLDFGTTNSLASIVLGDEKMLTLLNDDRLPHPSVVRYHGGEVDVGRKAKNLLATTDVGIIDDFVRSPKCYLGRDEEHVVGGVARSASDVVAEILKHIRNDALQRDMPGEKFDQAVMTIPVKADGSFRRDLRKAAEKAGIRIHQFVQEPFAALYGYLRSDADFKRRVAELEGKTILVFDWGGGTLDLTLCTIIKGRLVQIQSKGDDRVGGDKFDERLVRYIEEEHAKQHNINYSPENVYPLAKAKLIAECETAKIALSDRRSSTIAVAHYLQSDGPERTLEVKITREKLIDLTKDIVNDGMKNIDELLESSGLDAASIELCVATGGMVRMPRIRDRLLERFDLRRVPKIENGDSIISEGAAWIAHDKVKLTLAKPFELLLGDSNYSELLREGDELPSENNDFNYHFEAYCADPRDGYGKFQFARPVWPGRDRLGEPRSTYAILLVPVVKDAEPLTEKLNIDKLDIDISIDRDLVLTVAAKSTLSGSCRKREIHNLEFGLSLGPASTEQSDDKEKEKNHDKKPHTQKPGTIEFRSNIARRGQSYAPSWECVPWDLIDKHKNYLDSLLGWNGPTRKQIYEKKYYLPCSPCQRTWYQIQLEGSEHCKCRKGSVTEIEARERRAETERWHEYLKNEEKRLNDENI